MIYQSFLKSLNLPVLLGTSLGLLMPGMSALSATHEAIAPESLDSGVARSEELLIAQGGCPRAIEILSVETSNFIGSICEDGDGSVFYHGYDKYYGTSVNVYGASFTDSGYYMATTLDDNYNEYTYIVGENYIQVLENGNSIVYEESIY